MSTLGDAFAPEFRAKGGSDTDSRSSLTSQTAIALNRERGRKSANRQVTLHSITSSARKRNDSGRSNPITFAVLRLTVRKNRVGCSIGKSAGLAPLKILSTRIAD